MSQITFSDGLLFGRSDKDLKDILERKMPSGVSVYVYSCEHTFGGAIKIPAKKVVIEESYVVIALNYISSLFQQTPRCNYFNNVVVSNYLLGDPNLEQEAVMLIRYVCDRNITLTMYFSTDGKSIAVDGF